jgi:hypothetical protein
MSQQRAISESVGAGGVNLPEDVRVIQDLLNRVPAEAGGPVPELVVDGIAGDRTNQAIFDFQLAHFGVAILDGRVDPGQATFRALNEFSCAPEQIAIIEDDINRAKAMVDQVLLRLSGGAIFPAAVDQDMKQKVLNIFNIDLLSPVNADTPTNAFRFTLLVEAYRKLRTSLDLPIPKVCEGDILEGAFVSTDCNDPTIHFTPIHWTLSDDKRAVTIVHERAHTVLCLQGHPGIDSIVIGILPHEGAHLSYDNASRNAYCYEWLTFSLQPDYNPDNFRVDQLVPDDH